MWLRLPEQRRGRECVIPDVSRTFHFGAQGVNMNAYFQSAYFNKHALNRVPRVPLAGLAGMTREAYDRQLATLIAEAVPRSASEHGSPCADTFVQPGQPPHVMYIRMAHETDFAAWLALAKCWHIWDLDARGFHKRSVAWAAVGAGKGQMNLVHCILT